MLRVTTVLIQLLAIVILHDRALGVTGESDRFHYAQVHMGVRASITLYADSEDIARAGATAAFARIARLDAILSDWRVDSDLTRANKAAGGRAVRVDPELVAVLERCGEINRLTDGAFDPALGPLVMQWRTARKTGQLPTPHDRAQAQRVSRWNLVEIDPRRAQIRLRCEGMRLDLGGIGKGYAAQEAVKTLTDLGLSRCLVALAGDVVAGDPPPGQAGWTVGIDTGLGETRTILLRNAAVSTSGDTEQFVEIGGTRYSHIVDPATGLGKTQLVSASVVAQDGATADALATALSVAGVEHAGEIHAQFPQCEILVVQRTDDLVHSVRSRGFPPAVEAAPQPRPATPSATKPNSDRP